MSDMRLSRRAMLGATAAGAAMLAPAAVAQPARVAPAAVRSDGTYASVPLARESWTLGIVQSRVLPVDVARIDATRRANLAHMISLIDAATEFGAAPQMLLFHEFPITGFRGAWNRADILRLAIEVPGEETEALAKKAREKQLWLVFGSYVRDRDWPDHVLSLTTMIAPDGRIAARHWKARNIKGVFGGDIELFTTTIYDVYDRYVEMYGADEVVPILRTPLANFATSSVQREPELFRAMAIKGAEVILRTASGGFSRTDIAATSLYNGVYTAIANNSISPGSPFFEDSGAGGSALYGPDGEPVSSAASPNETLVTARIPIGAFRARHRQPTLHKQLYADVLDAYTPRYPPNLFAGHLPADLRDAGRYLADKGHWK